MYPAGARRDRLLTVLAWGLLLSTLGACAAPQSNPALTKACVPRCARDGVCQALDAKLIAARRPLLECVGQAAGRGHLAEAHRCYRALRLLESARWWLRTLTGRSELQAIYQPAETIQQEFLCRIEQLAQAKTPQEVERIYLEMIRSYP